MNNTSSQESFAQKLLSQEEALNETEYQEYQKTLQTALTKAERGKRISGRIAAICFFGSMVLMFFGGGRILGSFDPTDDDATIASTILAIVYATCLVSWPIAAASYFTRFSPRVLETRDQIRDLHLLQIRQELRELRQHLKFTVQSPDSLNESEKI